MGFQHGAELQQQQQIKEQMRREGGMGPKGQLKFRIRDVWRGNLAQEMELLRDMVESYPYISMVRSTTATVSILTLWFVDLNLVFRILNSLASSLARWVLSLPKQITITKPYAVMSTFSK